MALCWLSLRLKQSVAQLILVISMISEEMTLLCSSSPAKNFILKYAKAPNG